MFLPELIQRDFPVSNLGGRRYWHVLGGEFEANKEKYQSDLEDERKLFYVAVTRAKQNLFMTYELSMQPVSCFLKEAADSHDLRINRSDLLYCPTAERTAPTRHPRSGATKLGEGLAREEVQWQKQEYWAAVRYARSQLYDYYGTACHFFPAAYGALIRIKDMSPDEILYEAGKNGLI